MTWTADGGSDNAYAVDFSLSPTGPWFSTFEDLSVTITETSYTVPGILWNIIPSSATVYWRVRGADRDQLPLTVVTSDEVWSFTKQ
jgi:hypothetical protein